MSKSTVEETTTEESTTEVEFIVSVEDVKELLATKASELPRLEEQIANAVINPIMLARALDVKPQMIYNYIRNGRINAVRENNTQKMYIEMDEAMRFTRSYLDRKARKALKVEAELNGEA